MTKIIHSVCVCGAGTMGSGIAQASAQSGFPTILYDLNPAVLEKARESVRENLQKLTAKGKISSADSDLIYNRLKFTGNISDCVADLLVEAIVENPGTKINLFSTLAGINSEDTIFATNTSSLSVTSIAEKIKNPERVAGMHFFNPATIMKLVEVIRTSFTNDETIAALVELAKRMGKVPVICKDAPGFIVNRVARPFYIESLRIAEQGETDLSQIDALMEATGFKLGPFKLMDLIGNDVNYAVSCSVYDQLGRPERLRPSYLQEEKVRTGKLGRKSGEGYYSY